MGGPPSAELFPVLITQRAGVMTEGAMQIYAKVPGGWAYLFISWKGTLIITTMLLTPPPLFFFFLIFAVTLSFLQGNKSVARCNKKKLFFLSSLPERGGTFYDHLFLATTVTKNKGG